MNRDGSIEDLLSPIGGLIGRAGKILTTRDPRLVVYYAELGNLKSVLPNGSSLAINASMPVGIGVAIDDHAALEAALSEALERYAAHVYSSAQFIWAPAVELGSEALDLDRVPRCSVSELSNSSCPLVLPDKELPIRWVRGISLMTGKQTWIPAVMVYLGIVPTTDAERFVLATSTGCASHNTLEQALANGICEVIERDAVALVWLQQLSLPEIEFDVTPPTLTPYLQTSRESSVKRHFFDATTDLGVPTVYGIEVSPFNKDLATLVACATDVDPVRAISKVICDLSSHRPAMQLQRSIPSDPEMFDKAFHGTKYMGRPEHQAVFDFLLGSSKRRQLSELLARATVDTADGLARLLQHLGKLEAEVFAVDLTTDEAKRAGMRVVRVVIPALQPVSFRLRARYLAHERLFDAPRKMGYPVRSEATINPWPQPFG